MNSLWDLPLVQCLEAWDDYDKRGTDLAGIRALAQVDRYYLLVKVMKRVDLLHPWLYARCREVEREPDGYLDLWAREHYKSTIITLAGAIQLVLNDPEQTIGIFSHTKSIAKGFLGQIKREFESNEDMKQAFPDILWQVPDKQSPMWSLDGGLIVIRKTNPKEATIEGHGLVDGQPTGRHFKTLIYDDVVTRESVNTSEQIQKTTESWELSDNLGSIGCRRWYVGTRYSYADSYQAMMNRGSVKVRLYPATHNGMIDGDPVLMSQAEWDRKVRDQGEATISCQMLQNPVAGNQRMFDVEDLQVYEIRPETIKVYIMCDPAKSLLDGADSTAIAVIGIDYNLNKYLLDGFNHKMDLRERWTRCRDMWIKWKQAPGVKGIKFGYESFSAQADLDYFEEQMKKPSEPRFPITLLNWVKKGSSSKVDRVQRLTPDMIAHKIFVPYETNPERLTKNQRTMYDRGYAYRISKAIKRIDSAGNIYDLSEHLRLQFNFFPYSGKKDLIDVTSRIYDMDPTPPAIINESNLEPEFT